ncbi:alpha-N-arabinofuranosidase [Sphingomonas sp. CFBP 8760]|uniref:alpha-N-arabinofuranosidase n=1 Tax=Sphingomonas sp. CFBP 8760 TaxID=2775282 RepID=UPI001781DC13|nr:alpha-L-arabinofuranosidase C-terminal domain-containing protein [Sphingomonas sp. CFBP 8760]MBD8548131.1 alpha-N-arabinofuranosidase [Sphingomonas sp. CFBP 8760]
MIRPLRSRWLALLAFAATVPAQAQVQVQAQPQSPSPATTLLVHADRPGPRIAPEIYGQFVEHLGRGVYEGIWVGEDSTIPNTRGIRRDVVAALRQVKVPVIRWPGGCFADSYHWRNGIGPKTKRAQEINASWGGKPDTNAFGTHEFMDFMGQIGAAPFVSVNVGSGSVQEADDWMRYMTAAADSDPGRARAANGHAAPWAVPFVGVGNETWGCGGNMTAETYAASFRHYAAFLRSYSGPRANLIAVGADTDDYGWTETMMARAMTWRPDPTPLALTSDRPLMWGLSLHFYTFAGNDWGDKGRNVGFDRTGWAKALARATLTDELIARHAAIMDRYDPQKKVALAVDEWGAWFASEPGASSLYLESTLRDAVIAGLSLNIFNRHADRVRMANLAQMVNVIQSLVLTRGGEMVVTPTWHVFDLYKVHQGATQIPVDIGTPDYVEGDSRMPQVSVSASRDAGGVLHLSIVNLHPDRPAPVTATLAGVAGRGATAETLTAGRIDTRIEFGKADPFIPVPLDGVRLADGGLALTVPARSVTMVTIR